MSPASIFFFFFIILLIAFSIAFDFWQWILFIGLIVFAGMIAHAYRDSGPPRYETKWRKRTNYNIDRNYDKKTTERTLRSKIDKEWDRQSSFGDASDLR